jgi:hypothetical protein
VTADIETRLPPSLAGVMATGILAIASQNARIEPLSIALFAIASSAYVVLSAIGSVRLFRVSRRPWIWLRSPGVNLGAFTYVAASGVLGAWLAGRGELASSIAVGLWAATLTSWTVLCCGFGAALVRRRSFERRRALTGGLS